ncbi:hypothetical protein [Leifsonia sp. NPDC058248]|uniref:hypothetical protein n=1 Tax=Leifsonia sp. NPDC058248 TaxID=3346402 RepID=UPI0036DE4D61
MTTTNFTLSAHDLKKVERRTERRMESLTHFAEAESAAITPVSLRAPLSRAAFVALSPERRLEVVRGHVHAELLARALTAKARRSTATEEEPPAPAAAAVEIVPEHQPEPIEIATPVAPTTRYVVACADGCGAMIPARGPRPVVAYAEPWHRPKPKPKAKTGR